jgi:DNA polymerase III gamma/tau subunit
MVGAEKIVDVRDETGSLVDIAVNYRPFSFEEICGQKGIVAEFKKRSLEKNWPSVMIFAGESGTGKTTLANIVAALINDPNPIDQKTYLNPNPESPESRAILSEMYNRNTTFYDASRMAKEDVLKLEETAGSSSLFGGSTVLIIDEAQELSKTSKGVVLKLLEKKRDDTYIILCTMNPDAFDKSIRSRGLLYTFRSPTITDIATNLFNILDRKKITVPDPFVEKGLFLIAENCEGSVRMSVQMLERCLAGEFFSADEIAQEFGLLSLQKLGDIMLSVIKCEEKSFETVRKQDAREFFFSSYRFISDCLIYVRTKTTDAEWKVEQYSRFQNTEQQLSELFAIYADIERNIRSVFNSSYFFCRLSEYYKGKAVPEKPVRTR